MLVGVGRTNKQHITSCKVPSSELPAIISSDRDDTSAHLLGASFKTERDSAHVRRPWTQTNKTRRVVFGPVSWIGAVSGLVLTEDSKI